MQLTWRNLTDITNSKTEILIIYCHTQRKNKNLQLIIEQPHGKRHSISLEEFNNNVSFDTNKPKLALLVACESENFGYLLLKKGISHVVCIKDECLIFEDSMKSFLSIFLQKLYQTTISQAFKESKETIGLCPDKK